MTYKPANQGGSVSADLDHNFEARDDSMLEPLGPEIVIDGKPAGGHVLGIGIDTRTAVEHHFRGDISAQTVLHFFTTEA
jgi:hypothetical protein